MLALASLGRDLLGLELGADEWQTWGVIPFAEGFCAKLIKFGGVKSCTNFSG